MGISNLVWLSKSVSQEHDGMFIVSISGEEDQRLLVQHLRVIEPEGS